MSHTVLPHTVLPRTGPAPMRPRRAGAGFSPVPHRYRLYLRADCPRSRRVAAALAALGIEDSVATTVLGTGTEAGSLVGTGTGCGTEAAGHTALRLAYEAAGHHFDGTLTVPALVDTWSGRVVSDHTPDILDDLHFLAGHPAFRKAS
ncbi:hypothetical protein PV721_08955 [Streptomyces sp. MB09-01]|uniref:hypothetical protein n=1 Tax=Streptomyces sp. MB09-01 TaxID=3028666 RepID=UPI0029B14F3E|nr:hypothetical protein [Streptomyces sp. MB09-01]MDX3534495.1 hypothetical protein [Streptomyces sp. MB09-01]